MFAACADAVPDGDPHGMYASTPGSSEAQGRTSRIPFLNRSHTKFAIGKAINACVAARRPFPPLTTRTMTSVRSPRRKVHEVCASERTRIAGASAGGHPLIHRKTASLTRR